MAISVLPHSLSSYNGSIVDVDSKVGSSIEIDVVSSNELKRSTSVNCLPEVVFYEHIDFGGASERTNLNYYYVGSFWNDKISSIVVVSGIWEFFEHHHYEGRSWKLGPGYYRWIVEKGIPNDMISSFRCISLTN